MTATLTMDSEGRIVLPKRFREKLNLVTGSKLRAKIVGDKLELEVEPPETRVVINKSGLRVIVGWEGFDAVAAIKQDRAERENTVGRGCVRGVESRLHASPSCFTRSSAPPAAHKSLLRRSFGPPGCNRRLRKIHAKIPRNYDHF